MLRNGLEGILEVHHTAFMKQWGNFTTYDLMHVVGAFCVNCSKFHFRIEAHYVRWQCVNQALWSVIIYVINAFRNPCGNTMLSWIIGHSSLLLYRLHGQVMKASGEMHFCVWIFETIITISMGLWSGLFAQMRYSYILGYKLTWEFLE